MGMFDTIHFESDCFKCGQRLKEFQSKSGDNVLGTLTPDQLYKIAKLQTKVGRIYAFDARTTSEPTFYDYCSSCHTRNTYTFKSRRLRRPKVIAQYKKYQDDPYNKDN